MKTETKAAHTPGPWKLILAPTQIVRESGPEIIAGVIGPVDGPKLANARLMASAPDLLEAALGVISKLTRKESLSGNGGDCTWAKIDIKDASIRQLQEAIAKAEGK